MAEEKKNPVGLNTRYPLAKLDRGISYQIPKLYQKALAVWMLKLNTCKRL